MSKYVKTQWVNDVTDLDATNMNKIENELEKVDVYQNIGVEVDDDYDVNILHSKNLFNANAYNISSANANYTINSTNSINVTSTGAWGFAQIDNFVTEPNTNYVLKCNYSNSGSNNTGIIVYDEEGNTITYDSSEEQEGTFTLSISAPSDKIKIKFACNNTSQALSNQVTYTNIQINKGTTATTYEPFVQNQIYVNGTKFTDTINVGTSVDSDYKVNFLKSKNLLQLENKASTTINGITYSCSNGVITLSGISTSAISINFKLNNLKKGTYYLAKNQTGTQFGSWDIFLINGEGTQQIRAGEGTFTLSNDDSVYLNIYANKDTTFTNYTMKPMINEGSTPLEYEPYITPSINVNGDEIYSKPDIVELLSDTTPTANTSYSLNDSITNYKYIMVVMTTASTFANAVRQYIPVSQITHYSTDDRVALSIFQSTSVYAFIDLYFDASNSVKCNSLTKGTTGWTPHIRVYGIK